MEEETCAIHMVSVCLRQELSMLYLKIVTSVCNHSSLCILYAKQFSISFDLSSYATGIISYPNIWTNRNVLLKLV